jgi:hypothetical protein
MASQLPVSIEDSNPSALSMVSDTEVEIRTESFTCFPRLPPELKLHIWELALPTSRIVTALAKPSRPDQIFLSAMLRETKLHLLHVCHDSRATVMKTYSARQIPQLGRPFYLTQHQMHS